MKLIHKKDGQSFLVRMAVNAILIYFIIMFFRPNYIGSIEQPIDLVKTFLFSSLVFSFLNTIARPILLILSLPVLFITLGLFTIFINGLIFNWTVSYTTGLSLSFEEAIVGSLLFSLANYLITNLFWGDKK